MSWILTSFAVVVFIIVRKPALPEAEDRPALEPRTRPDPQSAHRRPPS